jgi:drug/metabolite transporter (DMT)-like permease
MGTDWRTDGAARNIITFGHLLVGGAALVFAGVMIIAGSAPDAGLGGVALPLGLLLALAATVFTYTAVMVLRRAPEDRRGSSLILSVVELVAGAATSAGVVAAVRSYGEPWRSPLFLPSALLLALGLAGLLLAVLAQRQHAPGTH